MSNKARRDREVTRALRASGRPGLEVEPPEGLFRVPIPVPFAETPWPEVRRMSANHKLYVDRVALNPDQLGLFARTEIPAFTILGDYGGDLVPTGFYKTRNLFQGDLVMVDDDPSDIERISWISKETKAWDPSRRAYRPNQQRVRLASGRHVALRKCSLDIASIYESDYCIQSNQSSTLSIDAERRGNAMRYINHVSDPELANCLFVDYDILSRIEGVLDEETLQWVREADTNEDLEELLNRVFVITSVDIKADEQLRLRYNEVANFDNQLAISPPTSQDPVRPSPDWC